jgi:hypothetical protein
MYLLLYKSALKKLVTGRKLNWLKNKKKLTKNLSVSSIQIITLFVQNTELHNIASGSIDSKKDNSFNSINLLQRLLCTQLKKLF